MASNLDRLEEFKQELRWTAVQYRGSIDSGDMYHAILQFAAEAALPTPGWADQFAVEAQTKALEKRKELWERRYQELKEEKRRDDELGQDPVERTKRIHDRLEKDQGNGRPSSPSTTGRPRSDGRRRPRNATRSSGRGGGNASTKRRSVRTRTG